MAIRMMKALPTPLQPQSVRPLGYVSNSFPSPLFCASQVGLKKELKAMTARVEWRSIGCRTNGS